MRKFFKIKNIHVLYNNIEHFGKNIHVLNILT